MTEHNVGWVEYENGFWRYYDESGTAIQGWKNINNKWYYFNEKEGREWMHRGWLTYNDNRYYFDQNGAMISGWKNIDNNWYYFDQDDAMQKSKWIENCYLNEKGKMATNTWIDNKYYVDSNGKYVPDKTKTNSNNGNDKSKNYDIENVEFNGIYSGNLRAALSNLENAVNAYITGDSYSSQTLYILRDNIKSYFDIFVEATLMVQEYVQSGIQYGYDVSDDANDLSKAKEVIKFFRSMFTFLR